MSIHEIRPKHNETVKAVLVGELEFAEDIETTGVIIIRMTKTEPVVSWSSLNSMTEARGALKLVDDLLADEYWSHED